MSNWSLERLNNLSNNTESEVEPSMQTCGTHVPALGFVLLNKSQALGKEPKSLGSWVPSHRDPIQWLGGQSRGVMVRICTSFQPPQKDWCCWSVAHTWCSIGLGRRDRGGWRKEAGRAEPRSRSRYGVCQQERGARVQVGVVEKVNRLVESSSNGLFLSILSQSLSLPPCPVQRGSTWQHQPPLGARGGFLV